MDQAKEQVFKKPSVLICGYGIVGKHLKETFEWADIYDKYKPEFSKVTKEYDFCFISVPTPMKESGEADVSQVEDVIKTVKAKLYIIKSTVPPNTTKALSALHKKCIIFSPEYQGNTQHANISYNFVILGGDRAFTNKVAQLYQLVHTCDLRIYKTDSTTAELCKYMENSFLACKVTFCNEFYRIAKQLKVDYTELRELFVADSRIGRSHTFVYEDYPYYDSKCFNKDLPAIVFEMNKNGYDASFVKAIISTNDKFKMEETNEG